MSHYKINVSGVFYTDAKNEKKALDYLLDLFESHGIDEVHMAVEKEWRSEEQRLFEERMKQ